MFPFNYHLAEQELQVRLGSWVVRRLRYDDMESVREGGAFWNEHWTNCWPPRVLTIRRKTGWVRNFVFNPPDTEAFLKALQERIRRAPFTVRTP